MMSWDPVAYLKYGGERIRPAVDLLAQVPDIFPNTIYDLGCGPGNSTALLAARWPAAHVTGIDGDEAMLARAKQTGPKARWIQGDIVRFQAEKPADLIFSNAVLHWIDNHQQLFPHLVSQLRPGGVLAVQMPCNHHAASHRLLYELAAEGPWKETLAPLIRPEPVAPPEVYYRLLSPLVSKLDIWETTYLMLLSGQDPVLAWIRGTVLRPYLDALPPAQADLFERELAARLRQAYPQGDGDQKTIFPFRRLFIIAQR